jgi:hypothetical protein
MYFVVMEGIGLSTLIIHIGSQYMIDLCQHVDLFGLVN